MVNLTDRSTLAVRFHKPWQNYVPGDVACFPSGTAMGLVRGRRPVAEAVNYAGAPELPDPNARAVRTPPRHVTK